MHRSCAKSVQNFIENENNNNTKNHLGMSSHGTQHTLHIYRLLVRCYTEVVEGSLLKVFSCPFLPPFASFTKVC